MWHSKFWKCVHIGAKLPKEFRSKSLCSAQCSVPRSYFNKEDLNLPTRPFHTTSRVWLRTYFSETEQAKIVNFVNKLNSEDMVWTGKLRAFNKIAQTLPESGPINDVNDLMEKYSLPAATAVQLCKSILKANGEPSELLGIQADRKKKKRSYANNSASRKLSYLWRTIKPEVSDPKSISSFTCVVVAERCIAFAMLEKRNDWNSQVLTDWNVYSISDNSHRTDIILNLSKILPEGECFVVASVHSLQISLNQMKLHGIVLALLCAKYNFREDMAQKLFELNSRSAARHFNLIVGNEVVSSTRLVSDVISSNKMSNADDHVYRRSLQELTFEEKAVQKFEVLDDDSKEPLSQSLIVAKAFIEILKT